MTTIVNIKNTTCDVYIGRGSIWGNPYSHYYGTKAQYVVSSRGEAIAKYEEYIRAKPELMALLPTLVGKRLGCYCKQPHKFVSCHGDVLIKLIQELNLEKDIGNISI